MENYALFQKVTLILVLENENSICTYNCSIQLIEIRCEYFYYCQHSVAFP